MSSPLLRGEHHASLWKFVWLHCKKAGHVCCEHHASLSKFMWLHSKKAGYVCWLWTKQDNLPLAQKKHSRNKLYNTVFCYSFKIRRTGDYLLFHCSEAEHFQVVDFCHNASEEKAEDLSINSFQEGLCQNHQVLLGRGGGYFVYFFKKDMLFSGYLFIYFVIAVGAGFHNMSKGDILFDWIIAQFNFYVLEYDLQQFFHS